jgi:hypothetical protein
MDFSIKAEQQTDLCPPVETWEKIYPAIVEMKSRIATAKTFKEHLEICRGVGLMDKIVFDFVVQPYLNDRKGANFR